MISTIHKSYSKHFTYNINIKLWVLQCLPLWLRHGWSDDSSQGFGFNSQSGRYSSIAFVVRLISHAGTEGLPLSSLICEWYLPHFNDTDGVILGD